MKTYTLQLLFATAVLGSLVPSSFGANIMQTYTGGFPGTITGTLPTQGTALLEMFTLAATSNLTITSTSYATGGFEPNLFLYDSSGHFVTSGNPFGVKDPSTGVIGDVRLTDAGLAAGTYTLAVTDFWLNQSLTATSLSDGFTSNLGNGSTFADVNGNVRSGAFAATIAAVGSAVPEPATFWLAAPCVAAVLFRARKVLTN